ncbi:hypothetical protein ACFLXE_03090 [Chloroflexota bacterium]
MNNVYEQEENRRKEVVHMGEAGTPAAERAIPRDTTRGGPGQAVATVDIVVPAFNEGGCIKDLLKDVVIQTRVRKIKESYHPLDVVETCLVRTPGGGAQERLVGAYQTAIDESTLGGPLPKCHELEKVQVYSRTFAFLHLTGYPVPIALDHAINRKSSRWDFSVFVNAV